MGSVGGLTLLSRVLGLVRDTLFARYIGASFVSDAFLFAFRLPNMFRALFAEGAFASAFIPMFNQKVADPEGPGLPAGIAFAERAMAVLLPVLIVMTIRARGVCLAGDIRACRASSTVSAAIPFAFAVTLCRASPSPT